MTRRSGERSPNQRPVSHDAFLIVAFGASAGGLDALQRLLASMPSNSGMAFIVIQHLDPTHPSMMVDLLASHTTMPVHQAADGQRLLPDHVFVIPPGVYLAASEGRLHLSEPLARHGSRLPVDFLLQSLAQASGQRAVAVILSGTGSDGSAGASAIRGAGGFVIAQSPDDAQFDGMPSSAIASGAVDTVLPLADIPRALLDYNSNRRRSAGPTADLPAPAPDSFWSIITLLRDSTAHDFTLYKPGTLLRRIERRMALADLKPTDMPRYLTRLREDQAELGRLAKDLLINVTAFFRDSDVFDLLETQIIPDLLARRGATEPLRIWIAGCSTGEETYSLAILCHEQMQRLGTPFKLQVFASDVDADAVAAAREGLYPLAIEADVTQARLARYFTREDDRYRISPELRRMVVFTVQDVLSDPPFSRLDMVSCRNLLIYLRPEAQARIIGLFHFALLDDGILLLGNAETIGLAELGFDSVARKQRIYRRIGRSLPTTFRFAAQAGTARRSGVRSDQALSSTGPISHQVSLADLVRRIVLETYAPAAILINRHHDCLYSLGPVDRYLQVAAGTASHELLSMTRPALRTRLRTAIRRAGETSEPISLPAGTIEIAGSPRNLTIEIRPLAFGGEPLHLICFVESNPDAPQPVDARPGAADATRVATLERELTATRAELLGAIHDLELSSEDQKAINEEALSINEEFQSTNEELLTSKEELQSLNEELTVLNGQLQETLERQRTTANDLQNVLFSTDMATLFLDPDLKIRFFTPATCTLFKLIQSDIGRPLADLTALGGDGQLTADAHTVLETHTSVEREVGGRDGTWFTRRILPYRTQPGSAEGVVITFIDITERKTITAALEAAKQAAEHANAAKSRFLAAASHDLRQPLQTLSLLQGLLGRTVSDTPAAAPLIRRLERTVDGMSVLLNTLLDINQIEAGIVKVNPTRFPIGPILEALAEEFSEPAQARGLALRVLPSQAILETDRPLLEQILRNLVSNAIKYTSTGRVLIGCRRAGRNLRIEIWDTGIGIPATELEAIFEEYHQLDNPARERRRGLGLGLSIVQRLANLLEAPVQVRSWPNRGSVFSITFPRGAAEPPAPPASRAAGTPAIPTIATPDPKSRPSLILVVEDDPDVRALLVQFLEEDGNRVVAAPDGITAIALVAAGAWPDLIIADYNLPSHMNGVAVVQQVRTTTGREVPVIILTGDISSAALNDIAGENCVPFNKPMSLGALAEAIHRLMPATTAQPESRDTAIVLIDDDPHIRAGLRAMLEAADRAVSDYPSAEAFLAAPPATRPRCLLIDGALPGMSGLDLLRQLRESGNVEPALLMTGTSDTSMAVAALQAGAADVIEKPIHPADLLARIDRAIAQARDQSGKATARQHAADLLEQLTERQREVMDMVLAGRSNKVIAAKLGISQRTVDAHRAAIMHRTATTSLPALARLALIARGV